ncbi:Ig-like domain-containing protein [Sphingobacterium faecium]|uniref:Ig-like domain-containing protein n=1 Tax=Sphingobacterium faecium TaxID=34087 RepID=UPI00247A0A93|nr:Ig-like domain-containing protein [Sphingobacterium faecium]WGQ15572.1 Ig-like domain-containing protein [Sphingobacterium faecium]
MKRILFLAFIAIATSTTMVGCSKKDSPEPKEITVSSISVKPEVSEMVIGESIQLSISFLPTNAKEPIYEISSSNSEILKIENLKITGLKEGDTDLEIKVKGANVKTNLKIKVLPISPVSLDLSLEKKEISIGESAQVKYAIQPQNTTNIDGKTILWSSSDENIAVVDSTGIITGKSAGKVDIIGKIEGTAIIGKISISVTTINVNSITLQSEKPSLIVGEKTTLFYTVLPENATNKSIRWSSSNNNIATVSDGIVTAISIGTVKINAVTVDGEKSASVEILVINPKVSNIILNRGSLKLEAGLSEQIFADVYPSSADDKSLTWTSSNTSVASVDNSGNVTAKSSGTAQIIAKSKSNPSIYAVCNVQVVNSADLVQTYVSSTSAVIINGVYTGNVSSVISNLSSKTVKFISFQIKNSNGSIVSQNNDSQNIESNKQITFSARLTNVNLPVIYYLFEIDGKQETRTISVIK